MHNTFLSRILLKLFLNFPLFVLIFLLHVPYLRALESILEHRQGSGVGYRNQYSKIELFHAFENQSIQPVIDLRYLILDHWKQGGNLGAGLGYQFSQKNRVSFYTYFDLTTSKTNYLFNQITPGIAYTHPLIFSEQDQGEIAIYLNSYLPFKSKEKKVRPSSFAKFQNNQLLMYQTDRLALSGANLEVGYRSSYWKDWNCYLSAGAYFFKRSSLNTHLGGMGKFRIGYCDFIHGELVVSHDSLFGTNFNGALSIRIPWGKRERKAIQTREYDRYRSRPIERLEPIVLKTEKRKVVARDSSGAPLHFIFVNNTSGSNGTFKDPFATLLEAQNSSKPGDYIYVFSGDGTTSGMSDGFTMQTGQTLAGSGVPLVVSARNGTVTIPSFTSTNPQITSTTNNGITIANNCVISGIDVVEAESSGFFSPPITETSTLIINHCSATGNGDNGYLFAAGGSAQATILLNDCSAYDNDLDGFEFFIEDDANVILSLNQCLADGSSLSGFEFFSQTTANLQLSCFQCYALNNFSGFAFTITDSARISASFDQCSATDNGSLVGLSRNGFFFSSSNTSQLVTSFNRCFANNNKDNGLELITADSAQATTSLYGCFASSNGETLGINGSGIKLSSNDTSQISASLDTCSCNSNQKNGFLISGTLSGSIENCSAAGNSEHGFNISTSSVTITTGDQSNFTTELGN
jgi:hypothetical protein